MSDQALEPQVITLGCRLNIVESEAIRRHASSAGLKDCVIINTCAVTQEALRQAAQSIRRIRRQRPAAKIIVTGCAAQIDPQRFASMPEADYVIGNAEKLKAETYLRLADTVHERVLVNDIMSVRETAGHMIDGFTSRARAFIQIQNGCDHRCTFCIIPFGRGPARSVPAGDIVDAVRRLAGNGYSEAVLTGVDITSYGADLPGEMSLGHLVRHILKQVPELPRLRLSSIDLVETDPHLLAALADEPRLMPHLHLSLQSGDDMILKRMKRRHLQADSIAFCREVRRLRPDTVFGADLIAGFPTETEAMFTNTLNVIDDCGLTYLHVFGFSPREGTAAARMPQIAKPVIKERAGRLRNKGNEALHRYLDSVAGTEVEVLIENGGIGRTPHFAEVSIGTGCEAGHIRRARTLAHNGRRLSGEVIT
ncbi:MAG: tRNA (N(6)-L-threonylcarbamoyladenosine(37)-C(2))-methylthiotransferase MtaB [Hyphomicrobium sp.]